MKITKASKNITNPKNHGFENPNVLKIGEIIFDLNMLKLLFLKTFKAFCLSQYQNKQFCLERSHMHLK